MVGSSAGKKASRRVNPTGFQWCIPHAGPPSHKHLAGPATDEPASPDEFGDQVLIDESATFNVELANTQALAEPAPYFALYRSMLCVMIDIASAASNQPMISTRFPSRSL
jgi:hypothetical protein